MIKPRKQKVQLNQNGNALRRSSRVFRRISQIAASLSRRRPGTTLTVIDLLASVPPSVARALSGYSGPKKKGRQLGLGSWMPGRRESVILLRMEGWQKLGIFVASTAEVKDFRDVLGTVATDLNHTLGRERKIFIDLIRWETHARPAAGRPQAVINQQIDSYDLFVGILWKRFGTPIGLANSGTEEEFRIA